MHRAPAVSSSVKRSRWQGRVIAFAVLLAVATLTVFVREQAAVDVRSGAVAFAILVSTGVALAGWLRAPQGSLHWDGQHWHWSGFAADAVCSLDLLMDFQSVVLVRIRAEAGSAAFLWLEGAPGDAHWRSLRRALVSSQMGSNTPATAAGVAGGESA